MRLLPTATAASVSRRKGVLAMDVDPSDRRGESRAGRAVNRWLDKSPWRLGAIYAGLFVLMVLAAWVKWS